MADRHDLIVTVSETGEIVLQVQGVNGAKCLKETDFIAEDFGEIISQEFTSEYYKQDTDDTTNIKNKNY